MVERLKLQDGKIEKGGSGYTVYCSTENKVLYVSSGKMLNIERIVARQAAYGHAQDLGHKVLIFETGKLKNIFN